MSHLDYFKKFVTKSTVVNTVNTNYEVWSYTRVSTKDQFEKNSSVERQIETNREFALKHSYQVTEQFGGTYESAKDDFTRKEFKRLIDKIESSRKKPYAILIFKASRFSRSGGGAIGLVNYLVEDLGVHLVETSSGISTTTERGKIAIYERLFQAHVENVERKEVIVPAMQSFLKKGYFMGKSPIGYDHYGPKVRNEKFLSMQQRIVVNADGELLRQAWKWKASGLYSDAQIIAKLAVKGLHISPQKLSATWRIPFYAGIIINRLIDEPAKGNWEPLVSMEDFIKVQNMLEKATSGNHPGYQHNKEVLERPLTRLLRCDGCRSYLVGHVVKKKGIHYYRCLKCKGYNLNAHTTKRALRKGANDLFIDFLKQYELPKIFEPSVKKQIVKLFSHYSAGQSMRDDTLQSQLQELEKKVKNLKIRHGLGEIDKETYDLTFDHLSNQLQVISAEMNIQPLQISNLEKIVSHSLKTLGNLSVIWASGDLENKRRIQKILFPEGVFYNAQIHEYRTFKVNEFVDLIRCYSDGYNGNKNANFQNQVENSRWVVRTGIEPVSKV